MRILPFIALSIPASLLAACATDDPAPAEAEATAEVSTPTKITIKANGAQALVAYRDFTDPVWHVAEAKSATRYIAKIHGPYLVTAVCVADIVFDGTVFGHSVNVVQFARTPGDGAELAADTCAPAEATTRDVSGHMAQAGRVLVGDSFDVSNVDDWTFQIPVLKGTYTLYASTADRIVIRRGLQVNRSVVIAPIDANVEGNLLQPASFVVTNPDGVATRAVVRIEQQAATFPGSIFSGPSDAARAIPTAVLTPDDNQTVSLQAPTVETFFDGQRTSLRASRRPWRIGDDPVFTLPAQFGTPFWFTNGNGDDVVFWSATPDFTIFTADVVGSGVDPSFSNSYSIDMSRSFEAQTFVSSLTFDTQIPGFQPAWKIDHAAGYFRDLSSQFLSNAAAPEHGVINSSSISDSIDPVGFAADGARTALEASPAKPGRARAIAP